MKRSILRALALCLTTAFAMSIATAQDDTPTRPGAPGSGRQTPGTPGIGSQSTYGTPRTSMTRAGEPVRASKLMNTSLKSQTGESLGQVQDIVLDPTSGQVHFAVISLGTSAAGAPGTGTSVTTGTGAGTTPGTAVTGTAGGQLVAIPWRLIQSSGQGQFTAMVDRTKLQSAPTFSATTWPTMDATWQQRIYTHFGTMPSTGAPGSESGTGTGTGIGNPSTPGVPSTPGTPDIKPSPGTGTTPGTGTGTGTGTSGSSGGAGGGAGGAK